MNEYYLIYLRKSRQDNENETVEEVLKRHERQLQEYAAKTFGAVIPEDRIYREIVSGETIEDRPEMKKVLKRIEDPLCKGVLVIEPQRLTRGDLLDCGTIVHAFRYSKTLVVTPTKTYDIEDKYDRKFFEMELTRGNDYLEYTKEILTRGREASVHEGNYIASIPPYGYKKIKNGKEQLLVIDPVEAEYVKLAFNMYVYEGAGANSIAHKLNSMGAHPRKSKLFRPTAIRQMLTNEVYIGKIRWGHKKVIKVFEDGKVIKKRPRNSEYELIQGKHEPIISEELFNLAQEQKKKSTREKQDYTLNNYYAGLIKCKKCGYAIAMRRHKNKEGKIYRKDRYYCRNGIYCDQKGANVDIVNDAIMKALKKYLQDFKIKISGTNKELFETQQTIIENMEAELRKLSKKEMDLYEYLEEGLYTKEVFKARMDLLKAEREELKDKIKKAKQSMPSVEKYQQQYYSLMQAIDAIENPNISAKAKNQLLKNIIEVIYYNKEEADVPNTDIRGDIELEIILK